MGDDIVAFFLTGGGATNPPVATGEMPPAGVIARIAGQVKILVGGVEAELFFAGLSGFLGVCQVVIRVPDLPAGEHEIIAEIDGRRYPTGLFILIG